MPNESRSNGMLLGAVIGGTMGILATLLLAPKSGAKMREELSAKYQSLCDKTKDIVESVKEEAVNLAEQAKESNKSIKDSFTASTEEIRDKLSSTDK